MTNEATTTTPAELAASNNLEAQIRQFTEFNSELVGSGSVKRVMSESRAKSADLWQVPPEEIYVMPGYNPRVHNRAYYEGISALASNMARDGYMQDKPLAVYLAKIDGKDRMVLQDGHRRHAAALYAKSELSAPIKTVPIVVKAKSEDAIGLLKAMLHANESTPFTVYEKAVVAKRFKSFGWTDKQIADEMGCTVPFVGDMLRLAGAPQAIQDLVNNGNLSATAALDIMKEHGEQAGEVATAAVNNAKAKGKSRATLKDMPTAADQKAKNAKKVAFDMYKLLVKLTKDDAVVKKIDDATLAKIDECIAVVEKARKPKELKPPKAAKAPKPIKVKTPAAKKTSVAKKIAAASAKATNAKQAEASKVWNSATRGDA